MEQDIMSKHIKKVVFGFFMAGFVSLTPISQVNAASIGLGEGIPDINLVDVAVTYDYTLVCTGSGNCNGPSVPDLNASFGELSITGSYDFLLDDGTTGSYQPLGATITLTANFDGYGLFEAAGSSFSIDGSTSLSGFDSGTFVSGDLFNSGFGGSDFNGTIEFEFNNTLGDFAAFGDIGGININTSSLTPGFSGTWDNDDNTVNQFFQTDFTAGASIDVFMPETVVVPVPAAVWLFGSGLLSLFSVIRIKRLS